MKKKKTKKSVPRAGVKKTKARPKKKTKAPENKMVKHQAGTWAHSPENPANVETKLNTITTSAPTTITITTKDTH